ncbi:MAG: glycosyltransferase family 2 protein [Planctomycetota bacterium]
MSEQTIAVVLPNYNHAAHLPAAIESVLAQTRPPDEFLIYDDASTDDSVDVIRSYARKHPVIQLLEGASNVGVHAAHRRLFEVVESDYVDPLAADDTRYPRCYELAMAMAREYPAAGILFGKMVIASQAGDVLATLGASVWNEPTYADPGRFIREYLEHEPPSQSLMAATIFRREPFQEVGWYCGQLGPWGDTFAANAIALKYGACYVPEPFACWRKAPGSFSQKTSADPRATLDVINRAAFMMQTPRYRQYFPAKFVTRWQRAYRWRTIKEYWRCDNSDEIPKGASIWTRYRRRLPRSAEALSLFWHRTDVTSLEQ